MERVLEREGVLEKGRGRGSEGERERGMGRVMKRAEREGGEGEAA